MPTFNLRTLTKDIESQASISVHKDGTWHKRWDPFGLTSLFRRLLMLDRGDNLKVAGLVKYFIKSTELISKNFSPESLESELDIELAIKSVKSLLKPQRDAERKEYKKLCDELSELKTLRDLTQDGLALTKQYNQDPIAIKGIEDRLKVLEKQIKHLQKTMKNHELTAPATTKVNKLATHFFALKMRSVEQSSIQQASTKDSDLEWVKQELIPWKKDQFPAMPINYDDEHKITEFSKDDLHKIETLCKYSKAIALMKRDRNYRESIFKFVFKTPSECAPNLADIAIQFPALTKKIMSNFIDKRVKRLTKTVGLSLKEECINDVVTKDVFLRIQKVDEPLRDMSRKISFNDKKTGDTRTITIDEIFKEFRTKDAKGGSPFEYTENGIDLCYPLSPVIDFESPTWWNGLPVIERLSRQEVEQKYSVIMAGKKAVLALRATREKDPLNIQGNHGWFQVVIPHEDGKTFTVHAFGKYAIRYPQGDIEALLFSFNTHQGVIATIDENEFYAHREHCMVPKTLTNDQFERLMDKLKRDLQDSINGNMVFQAQGQNCSAWVQEVLDDVFGMNEDGSYKIPRLYEVPVVETSARNPVNKIITFIRFAEKISHHLAKVIRIALATLLGGAKNIQTTNNGKPVRNNIISYEPWLRGYLALPGLLFSREKQQKLREAFAKL